MNCYVFDYVNENEFKKLERALKKYNMLAYKKLYFEYYPKLKEGLFLGQLVNVNKQSNKKNYNLKLPTDIMFSKVHGNIILHYIVYEHDKMVILDTISPEDILLEGHQTELDTYKGVMISKTHGQKDMFKINLLDMLGK
ncbi:MAG: hypothetical protein RR732_00415 [Bacilli bacterium]